MPRPKNRRIERIGSPLMTGDDWGEPRVEGGIDFSDYPYRIEIQEALRLQNLSMSMKQELFGLITDAGDEAWSFVPWARDMKSLDNAFAYIRRTVRDRPVRGPRYGLLSEGQLAGVVNLFPSETAENTVEIGYLLSPKFRGKGLATAAVKAAEGLIHTQTPSAEVIMAIDDANEPSIKIARKLGYTATDYFDQNERVYVKDD